MGFRGTRVISCVLALSGGTAGAECSVDVVELKIASGTVQRFHVEVADTPDEQAQGLMKREKMASSTGMLFVFPAAKRATFWMKDTLIPLDMIFIDQSGTVLRVHENAIPMDKTLIDGGEGVAFVLEINGGLARRLGIGAQTIMRHPDISSDNAVWSCDAP